MTGALRDQFWTEEQDAILRDLAPTTPYREVAARLGRSYQAVARRACDLGIQGRPRDERERGTSHHRWRGGTSAWRGEDWDEAREAALARDKVCRDCSSDIQLVVHHLIPYRHTKNNDLSNLLTLCRSCHAQRPEHYMTLEELHDWVTDGDG